MKIQCNATLRFTRLDTCDKTWVKVTVTLRIDMNKRQDERTENVNERTIFEIRYDNVISFSIERRVKENTYFVRSRRSVKSFDVSSTVSKSMRMEQISINLSRCMHVVQFRQDTRKWKQFPSPLLRRISSKSDPDSTDNQIRRILRDSYWFRLHVSCSTSFAHVLRSETELSPLLTQRHASNTIASLFRRNNLASASRFKNSRLASGDLYLSIVSVHSWRINRPNFPSQFVHRSFHSINLLRRVFTVPCMYYLECFSQINETSEMWKRNKIRLFSMKIRDRYYCVV